MGGLKGPRVYVTLVKVYIQDEAALESHFPCTDDEEEQQDWRVGHRDEKPSRLTELQKKMTEV